MRRFVECRAELERKTRTFDAAARGELHTASSTAHSPRLQLVLCSVESEIETQRTQSDCEILRALPQSDDELSFLLCNQLLVDYDTEVSLFHCSSALLRIQQVFSLVSVALRDEKHVDRADDPLQVRQSLVPLASVRSNELVRRRNGEAVAGERVRRGV